VLSIWLGILPIGLIGSGIPVLGVIISSAFISYVLVGLGTSYNITPLSSLYLCADSLTSLFYR
jgi:hypothetical protein